jgi:hypothetical protein
MEQQKIEEMKSVIAEYMGYKSSPDKSDFVKRDENGINDYRYKSDLKYHSSMDWLYPVWQKILNDKCTLLPYRERTAMIATMFSLGFEVSKIHEAIYNAIVWLNNNKK